MIALRMAIIEDGVTEVERCYTGDGLLPGINSRSFTVKIGPILSSRGQELDFKTIDFLRTRLVHNEVVVQHKYKRPDDLHVASRLVLPGYPSKRYIVAPSKTISGAIPAAISGEGFVIAIGGDKGVRPEGSRKDVAANLEMLSHEAEARRVALKQAAEGAMADAYAKGLVPSRVPEEMKEVHATAADTQQRVSEVMSEAQRLQKEAYPPIHESTSMNSPIKKMRSELGQLLPDGADNSSSTTSGFHALSIVLRCGLVYGFERKRVEYICQT
uniref:Protein kinase domain-containing protein n=1 Tax=Haemonchus placei TaxID=6290 RepID=A0A0N4WSW6_HAEPC